MSTTSVVSTEFYSAGLLIRGDFRSMLYVNNITFTESRNGMSSDFAVTAASGVHRLLNDLIYDFNTTTEKFTIPKRKVVRVLEEAHQMGIEYEIIGKGLLGTKAQFTGQRDDVDMLESYIGKLR